MFSLLGVDQIKIPVSDQNLFTSALFYKSFCFDIVV